MKHETHKVAALLPLPSLILLHSSAPPFEQSLEERSCSVIMSDFLFWLFAASAVVDNDGRATFLLGCPSLFRPFTIYEDVR